MSTNEQRSVAVFQNTREPNALQRCVAAPAAGASWNWVTLGAVLVAIDAGKSFKCDERPPEHSETGIVKVSAVSWGFYDEEESKTCTDFSRVDSRYLIKSGDFLFSRANTIQLVGACVIAGAVARRLMLSDKILRFRFKENVDARWVLHWLRSRMGRAEIERLATGNQESMRNIGQERIRMIALPLPPHSEQRRIVAEIEKQFTRLDAGVAALRRVQANLKRYRAAVLKAACEGLLVPTEYELARAENREATFESGEALLRRVLAECRKNWQGRGLYKEPALPDIEGLPQLPDGWGYASAEQACATVVSGSTPVAPKMFSGSGEVPFLKVYNLTHNGALDFSVKPTFIERRTHEGPLARSRVFPQDVLMNIVGPPLGKVSIVPDTFPEWNINQAIVAFRSTDAIQSRLLMYWLLSDEVLGKLERTAKATAGQFNLQVTACRKLALPIPPLAEQARIVAEVERRLSVIEELEATVSVNLHRATRLRQSILKHAFEGNTDSERCGLS